MTSFCDVMIEVLETWMGGNSITLESSCLGACLGAYNPTNSLDYEKKK